MTFQEALNQRKPLLADGATGTMLQRMGLPPGKPTEAWTLENPAAVRELARLYAAAGCDAVYTNTFGANRVYLHRFGLSEKASELNRAAVKLAREGVAQLGRNCFVIGTIGPTGEMLEPYGELQPEAARAAFAEQAGALAVAGVDAIVCESFTDLSEATLCLEAKQSATDLPALASMSFEEGGRTMMGVTPEDAVARLADAGATVVGVNCSIGLPAVEFAVRAMKAARPNVLLLAKPNAGKPRVVNGEAVYSESPASLAAFAKRMKDLGVAVIGGCCGTTPDHLRAMREAV
jgi:5-methyltetrahydrofolate--homocysteine methyltransferase